MIVEQAENLVPRTNPVKLAEDQVQGFTNRYEGLIDTNPQAVWRIFETLGVIWRYKDYTQAGITWIPRVGMRGERLIVDFGGYEDHPDFYGFIAFQLGLRIARTITAERLLNPGDVTGPRVMEIKYQVPYIKFTDPNECPEGIRGIDLLTFNSRQLEELKTIVKEYQQQ